MRRIKRLTTETCCGFCGTPFLLMDGKKDRRLYDWYIKTSQLWQSKRAWAIERAGGICQVCSTVTSLDVHHLTYKNMGHEYPHELIAVCRDCHERIHEND